MYIQSLKYIHWPKVLYCNCILHNYIVALSLRTSFIHLTISVGWNSKPFSRYRGEVQSISGCLSYYRKTRIQTSQSNASYIEMSPSMANLIGQFGFSFFCDRWDKQHTCISLQALKGSSLCALSCTALRLTLTYILKSPQDIISLPVNLGYSGSLHPMAVELLKVII